MLWLVISIVGLLIINISFISYFRSYQNKKLKKIPKYFWIMVLLVGVIYIVIFFIVGKIDDAQSFLLLGIQFGLLFTGRIIVGKEAEKMIDKKKLEKEDMQFESRDWI